MEKICRVLYKHGDLREWIAFEVYRSKKSFLENYYEAYWMSPLNEVLFTKRITGWISFRKNWATA
jgi:hypothetical protein